MTGDVQSYNRLPSYLDPPLYEVNDDEAVTEEGLVRGEYGRYYMNMYNVGTDLNVVSCKRRQRSASAEESVSQYNK